MLPQYQFKYTTTWMDNISRVDPAKWDALAVPLKTPFLEWEWLHLMEDSGSIAKETGWTPQHLTVWSQAKLVAAAPLYIKNHGAGEFVFDHAWADVAGRLGIAYYPKLVGMSPVTPAIGYRFLVDPQEDEKQLTDLMIAEIDRFCLSNHISGCSFLYVDPLWQAQILRYDFNRWQHQSFAWQNQNFEKFDDYLAQFNANQRRNIKRERRKIKGLRINITPYAGNQIPPEFLPLMYRFYVHTNDQFGPWSCKYLSKAFFDDLHARYRHRLVLMAVHHEQNRQVPMGMSLLITKGDFLYGRYWGSFDNIDSLHFNACYYSPIEWAIDRGIKYFDPGIGSEHKLRRGFRAVPNFSLHKFYDLRLQQIMQTHIDEINRLEQEHIDGLNDALPFAKPTD
jgi:predicted N-acyltransferase